MCTYEEFSRSPDRREQQELGSICDAQLCQPGLLLCRAQVPHRVSPSLELPAHGSQACPVAEKISTLQGNSGVSLCELCLAIRVTCKGSDH